MFYLLHTRSCEGQREESTINDAFFDTRSIAMAQLHHQPSFYQHSSRAIAFIEALPRTDTGKVQRYVLRERAWATVS